jgi:hypothetical protein
MTASGRNRNTGLAMKRTSPFRPLTTDFVEKLAVGLD